MIEVARHRSFLVARFGSARKVASWAIVGGGVTQADAVAWLEVRNADLPASVDPAALLARRLEELELGRLRIVGLLTSRNLDAYEQEVRTQDGLTASCVATVGLGNALRAGDPSPASPSVGTINVLCHISACLTDEALLEALGLATEAKTLAVYESGVTSIASGARASGTGTDCVVIACTTRGEPMPYAGKHTAVGHLIGAAVHAAVARGAEVWKREVRSR